MQVSISFELFMMFVEVFLYSYNLYDTVFCVLRLGVSWYLCVCLVYWVQLSLWARPLPLKPQTSRKGVYLSVPRITFHRSLVRAVIDGIKVSTIRLITGRSRGHWDSLVGRLEKDKVVVRACKDRASDSMFGWLEISSISKEAAVTTFLNEKTITDCGCEGWSDKRYVDRWCGGDSSKLVWKIDFIYHIIDSYSVSDYAIATNKVKEVTENYCGSLKPRKDTFWKLSTKLPPADDCHIDESEPVGLDDYRGETTTSGRTVRTSNEKKLALPPPPGPTHADVAATAAAAASEAVQSAVHSLKEVFAQVSVPTPAPPAALVQPQPVVTPPAPQVSIVDTKYENLLLGLVQEQKEERAYRRQMDLITQKQLFNLYVIPVIRTYYILLLGI